jgi:hypothetical protein
MKRIYTDGTSDKAMLFIGKEVEMTPAYDLRTLFVVGADYNPDELFEIATKNDCRHVYFGANMSFTIQPYEQGQSWHKLLSDFVSRPIWFTLDFQLHQWPWVRTQDFSHVDNFIPMVSVRIPHIQDLNYNACIKLDDNDFNCTNPGVWVHSVHDLKSRDVFTSWSEYTQDEIIRTEKDNG